MKKILITGGMGFVGSKLNTVVREAGFLVRITTHRKSKQSINDCECFHVGDLMTQTNWMTALEGVDVIVHCAGRAHVLRDNSIDPLAEFRLVNRDATIELAHQATLAGVKRFIFISTVGVNGAFTAPNKSFNELDEPNPHNAYSRSKFEAEQSLMHLAKDSNMELVIIRPPLVYGHNAPGNFGILVRLVKTGFPLPFDSLKNQRSFVAIDNLIDFIVICINHSKAANQTFLVSDGYDLSTTELLRSMSVAAGLSPNLYKIPLWTLKLGANLLGKNAALMQLTSNLQVDISKARSLLEWNPKISVSDALKLAMAPVK